MERNIKKRKLFLIKILTVFRLTWQKYLKSIKFVSTPVRIPSTTKNSCYWISSMKNNQSINKKWFVIITFRYFSFSLYYIFITFFVNSLVLSSLTYLSFIHSVVITYFFTFTSTIVKTIVPNTIMLEVLHQRN